MSRLGFASAACYRLVETGLVEVVTTAQQDEAQWPPAVTRLPFDSDYTINQAIDTILGWKKSASSRTSQSSLPNAAYLYFPEQQLEQIKIVFGCIKGSGKQIHDDEVSAALEILAGRIRAILKDQNNQEKVSELGIENYFLAISSDITSIIDHELRTPLAAISGYLELMQEADEQTKSHEKHQYWQIIKAQTKLALSAIDSLSLTLQKRVNWLPFDDIKDFDADAELSDLCRHAKEYAQTFGGDALAQNITIERVRSLGRVCLIHGSRQLFCRAIWEVIKNAINHSRYGHIKLSSWVLDEMLVIEVEDDGLGVPKGAEEIIFMRFFRNSSPYPHRHYKRGLGLGLFLARQIAELHNGTLVSRRRDGHGGIFRFTWPLSASLSAKNQPIFQREV